MADGPCKNPSCNSFGKPHPNCKCYGGMADGGKIETFCSEDRAHDKSCKYFAAGGQVRGTQPELKSGDIVPDDAPDAQAPAIQGPEGQASPELKSGDIVPDDATDDNPYQSKTQKAITTAEGFGRGFLGPIENIAAIAGQYLPPESLVPLGEKQFGFTPEDIKARQKENPELALSGEAAGLLTGALTGAGAVGAASKAGQAAAHAAELGNVGSNVISGMISNGLIQGGNEAGKWLLGQGDPSDAVAASLANVAGAGLLGGGAGAISAVGSKALQSLGDNRFLGKMQGFLSGIGAGAKESYDPDAVAAAEKAGLFKDLDSSYGNVKGAYDSAKSLFRSIITHPVEVAAGAGAYEGYREGGWSEALKNLVIAEGAGKILTSANKRVIVPVLTKAMQSGTTNGLQESIQHGINVVNGNALMDKAVDGILKSGTSPAINWFRSEEDRLKQQHQLSEYIENGGINQDIQAQNHNLNQGSGFAEGGIVEGKNASDLVGIGKHYPEQSMLLGVAKSRVSNYLNSIRPVKKIDGPIFDEQPDQTEQKRSYNKALDIANRPLSILQDVQKGTIDPEQIKHFQNMYPEINQLLQKKLTAQMVQYKSQDKKPTYNVRQSLSLLMGTPLSSELMPANIQAAQATFIKPQASQQQGQGQKSTGKGGKSLDKMGSSMMTDDQSREKRQQKV